MVRFLPTTALLLLVGTTPAEGQCRLCSTPVTSVTGLESSDTVTVEVETGLNFDRLVVLGAGTGSAELRPDGSRLAQGTVADIGPRAMVGTAILHGEPGRFVRVDLPSRIELYSLGGGEIAFDEVTSDLPAMPRLDSSGTLTFRFGGRLRITGDADGDYRGDLAIRAEYQ
jgi:Domain of unknown function (DUF4402)